MKKVLKFADNETYDSYLTGRGVSWPHVAKYGDGIDVKCKMDDLVDMGIFRKDSSQGWEVYVLNSDRRADFEALDPESVTDFFDNHKAGKIALNENEDIYGFNEKWGQYLFNKYDENGFNIDVICGYMFTGIFTNVDLPEKYKDELKITVNRKSEFISGHYGFFGLLFKSGYENTYLHIVTPNGRITAADYMCKSAHFPGFRFTNKEGKRIFSPINDACAVFASSDFQYFDCALEFSRNFAFTFEKGWSVVYKKSIELPEEMKGQDFYWTPDSLYAPFASYQTELTRIDYILDLQHITEMPEYGDNWCSLLFANNIKLEYFRIKNLKLDTDLTVLPAFGEESFQYMIENASNEQPITITLNEGNVLTDGFIQGLSEILAAKQISVYRGENKIV